MTDSTRCETGGCARSIRAKRLCALHYDRWIKSGRREVGPSQLIHQRAAGLTCILSGCEEPVRCKGLCRRHYDHSVRKDTCPCGKPKNKGSRLCFECHIASFDLAPKLTEKICPRCRRLLSLAEFGWRKTNGGRTKLRAECRNCAAREARERSERLKRNKPELYKRRRAAARQKDRELWKVDPERWLYRSMRRSARMLKLDVNQVLQHLDEQGNQCDACGWRGESVPGGRVHIDHDHATGLFRGFLCSGCNSAAGRVADCPERIEKLLGYLGRGIGPVCAAK